MKTVLCWYLTYTCTSKSTFEKQFITFLLLQAINHNCELFVLIHGLFFVSRSRVRRMVILRRPKHGRCRCLYDIVLLHVSHVLMSVKQQVYVCFLLAGCVHILLPVSYGWRCKYHVTHKYRHSPHTSHTTPTPTPTSQPGLHRRSKTPTRHSYNVYIGITLLPVHPSPHTSTPHTSFACRVCSYSSESVFDMDDDAVSHVHTNTSTTPSSHTPTYTPHHTHTPTSLHTLTYQQNLKDTPIYLVFML